MVAIMAHVNTSIGEAMIYIGQAQYSLRPSFRALAAIGDTEKLKGIIESVCAAYNVLLLGHHPNIPMMESCADMIERCAPDLPATAFGGVVPSVKAGLRWKAGVLPWRDLIILAHHCVKWGVYGDPKEKLSRAAKKKLDSEQPRDFDPAEFVAILIDEFGLSSVDAWNSTMTEFQRLCEHRNRKNWGDRPPPVDDTERDNLVSSYRQCMKTKATKGR